MKEKMKQYAVPVLAGVTALASSMPVYAAESSFDATTLVTTAATSMQGDMLSTISSVTPIALVVVGATIAIKFGIRFFQQLVGQRR